MMRPFGGVVTPGAFASVSPLRQHGGRQVKIAYKDDRHRLEHQGYDFELYNHNHRIQRNALPCISS